ncbi:MAG: PAS domain S-box protein [Chitinophagaceae bacterium]
MTDPTIKNEIDLASGNAEIYKDLFDNAHDLIYFAEPGGTLLYVNNAWLNALKYNLENVREHSVYNLVAEEDRERFRQYREGVLGGNIQPKQITVRLTTKDGKILFAEGAVSLKEENGQPLYTRGIFRDVTERVLYEKNLQQINQQLREEEENTHQLINNAPDAVIVIDDQSKITLWNPKAEQLFGWKSEEVAGHLIAEIIIPERYREAHYKGFSHYLKTGEAKMLNKTIETSGLNKEGQEFFIALTISSYKINSKTAFISFIRDITNEKNNMMELVTKTQALERSNQSLEEFAYAASHDLKEPIRKVQFFSDRLKNKLDGLMGEEDKNLFERMEKASQRMRLLVDDLLNYAHLNLNPLEKDSIDLNDKLKKVLEDLELQIDEKKAIITFDNLPVIKGYRRQLQQLFHNLIGNALKYSKAGVAPQIHIGVQQIKGRESDVVIPAEDGEKDFYLFTIQDNGIGFEQENAGRIFNMFQRLHGKAEYSGTGVGLSIARKVVHNHNGQIWAQSRPGEGAAFKVLLPAD